MIAHISRDFLNRNNFNRKMFYKISKKERLNIEKRINQIGISKWAEGAAIGLVEDGTCLIAKRPICLICEDRWLNFEHINGIVKSWNDLIQVAASDAFLRYARMVRFGMLVL